MRERVVTTPSEKIYRAPYRQHIETSAIKNLRWPEGETTKSKTQQH